MKPLNSVKLIPHDSVDLDRLSYGNGDLVFDVTLGTIRLMDGSTLGGSKIATTVPTAIISGVNIKAFALAVAAAMA